MAKKTVAVGAVERTASRAETSGELSSGQAREIVGDMIDVLGESCCQVFAVILEEAKNIEEILVEELGPMDRAKVLEAWLLASEEVRGIGRIEKHLFGGLPEALQRTYTVGMGSGFPLTLPLLGIREADLGDGNMIPATLACEACRKTWKPAPISHTWYPAAGWWKCPEGCNSMALAERFLEVTQEAERGRQELRLAVITE